MHVVNVGAQRSLRSGRDALARLVHGMPEADAVFCSSDLLAVGVATEARARQIAVPGQLAIMGFGDVPFVADMLPALSTVQIDGARIGRLAAQYLMDRAEGREVDPAVVQVDFFHRRTRYDLSFLAGGGRPLGPWCWQKCTQKLFRISGIP